MAITSRLHQVDQLGEKLVNDWQGAGLIKPSVFKPILATMENTLVIKQLGRLQDEDRLILNLILRDILGSNEATADPQIPEQQFKNFETRSQALAET